MFSSAMQRVLTDDMEMCMCYIGQNLLEDTSRASALTSCICILLQVKVVHVGAQSVLQTVSWEMCSFAYCYISPFTIETSLEHNLLTIWNIGKGVVN